MGFNEKQRSWAIRTMNYLYSWKITESFRAKFNPELEGYSDYNEKIKNPLSLNEVKSRLWDGFYKSVDEFVKDLKVPFENAISYHKPNTIYHILAEEILIWINEQTKYSDMSEDDLWYKKLIELQEKLENHISNMPTNFSQSIIPH